MPFPILRTPSVVLSEITSLLEPNEIVTASFCSKNLKHLLKKHFPRGKPLEWRLSMAIHGTWGRVSIRTSEGRKSIIVILAKHISEFKGRTLKENTDGYEREFASSKCPVLYFDDQELGSKTIVDYATDLFSLDINGLLADRKGIWAIDWINNRQEKMLERFKWNKNFKYNNSNADETVDSVLRNARVPLFCTIDDNVSDNYKFNGKLGPMTQLFIRSKGHWVTLNNLMNFDSFLIRIEGSRLSVPDLNSFLRHWRAGGSPRLTLFRLDFESDRTFFENFDEDLEIVETNEVRRYRVVADSREFVAQGGYSIQRMDGVKATINFDIRTFTMIVWHADGNILFHD
ncbi:unnamed protein product [Caenorhabditis nigoni]